MTTMPRGPSDTGSAPGLLLLLILALALLASEFRAGADGVPAMRVQQQPEASLAPLEAKTERRIVRPAKSLADLLMPRQ